MIDLLDLKNLQKALMRWRWKRKQVLQTNIYSFIASFKSIAGNNELKDLTEVSDDLNAMTSSLCDRKRRKGKV